MIQHILIQAAVYFSNLVVLNLRDFVMFEEPIPLLLFLKSHVTSQEKKTLEWSVTAARLHSLSEKNKSSQVGLTGPPEGLAAHVLMHTIILLSHYIFWYLIL